MFYYQKAVEYESSKFWVRIILALGTNHLNFGYESSGYETSVGTKRPDSPSGLRGKTGKMTENIILIGINTINIFTLQGKSPIGSICQFV